MTPTPAGISLAGVRRPFLTKGRQLMIYFDNAATSFPKPQSVVDAVSNAMTQLGGNPGRSSHALARAAGNCVFEARCALADLFGARAENVVFTYNSTYALNIALKASYIYGTHILISDLEHNSVLRPTAAVTGDSFASYSVFDSAIEYCSEARARAVLSSVRSRMRPLTRTLICTSRSNICGATMPIRQIGRFCRENGLFFIVDASQSAGYDELDVERDNIDALCAPGHKGLYGPAGTGFVIFSEHGADCGRLSSFIAGGNGVASLDIGMPEKLPEKLEGGTLGVPGIAGLAAGVEHVKSLGVANIRAHDALIAERIHMALGFLKQVKLYPYFKGSPIVLFNIDGKSPEDVGSLLDERGICVRAGYHCAPLAHKRLGTPPGGAVRLSVGYENSERDADDFIHAVSEIVAR